MGTRLQLRTSLVDSVPEIWRRLILDPRLTVGQLHTVLQLAYGWTNSHLHRFEAADGTAFQCPSRFDEPGDPPFEDERKVQIARLFPVLDARAIYEYDFGDGWVVAITLEAVVDSETVEYPLHSFVENGRSVFSGKERAAVLVAGDRNGPPDDCGGIGGLERLIQLHAKPPTRSASARNDRDDRDDREFLEWAGDWRPDDFELALINQNLGRVRVKKAFV